MCFGFRVWSEEFNLRWRIVGESSAQSEHLRASLKRFNSIHLMCTYNVHIYIVYIYIYVCGWRRSFLVIVAEFQFPLRSTNAHTGRCFMPKIPLVFESWGSRSDLHPKTDGVRPPVPGTTMFCVSTHPEEATYLQRNTCMAGLNILSECLHDENEVLG